MFLVELLRLEVMIAVVEYNGIHICRRGLKKHDAYLISLTALISDVTWGLKTRLTYVFYMI